MPIFKPTKTAFKRLLNKSADPVGLCFKLILLWIAVCDGSLDRSEHSFMRKVFGGGNLDSDIDTLVGIIEREVFDSSTIDSLEIASGFLRTNIDSGGRQLLLEMIIGISIADGRLSISENHILRFLSDLFELSPDEFEQIYSYIAGRDFPDPGDPGSRSWWEEKLGKPQDAGQDGGPEGQRQQRDDYFSSGSDDEMSVTEALKVLGLRGRPSRSEIKAAYRKLAQKHHPDKFASLGTDTLRFANSMFQRINQAYEVLDRDERFI